MSSERVNQPSWSPGGQCEDVENSQMGGPQLRGDAEFKVWDLGPGQPGQWVGRGWNRQVV